MTSIIDSSTYILKPIGTPTWTVANATFVNSSNSNYPPLGQQTLTFNNANGTLFYFFQILVPINLVSYSSPYIDHQI